MIPETAPLIIDFFNDVKDPRIERKKRCPLIEGIVITLLAEMASAKDREDIERVFVRLKPEAVASCFMARVRAIKQDIDREVTAIDGKIVRGSFNTRQGNRVVHMVSTRATENRLVFARVKTEEKSNEITAIPALLEMTTLKGCIVTIDAMGCQYKTANQIVRAGADYVFSLKENQETLYDDVKTCPAILHLSQVL
jgi:hypothetical protein